MSEALEKLGNLNPAQAEILKIILMRNPASIAIIGAYTKNKVDEIQKIIKELEGLKLIKSIPGVVPRYVGLPPYAGYLKFLDQFVEDLGTAQTLATDCINQVPVQASSLAQANVEKLGEIIQAAETRGIEEVNAAKEELTTKVSAEKEKFAEDMTKFFDEITLIAKDAPEQYKKATTATVGKHQGTLQKLKADLASELDQISSKLGQTLQNTENQQQKKLDSQKSIISTKIKETSPPIVAAASKVGEDWIENMNQMGGALDEKTTTLKSRVGEFGNKSLSSIQSSIKAGVTTFFNFLQIFNKTHQSYLTTLSTDVQNDLTALKNTQLNAWEEILAGLGDQSRKATELLQSLGSMLKSSLEEQVGSLISKEMGGMSSKLDQIKSQLANITTKYVDEFIGGADNIKTAIDQTVELQVKKTQEEIKQTSDGVLEKYAEGIKNQASIYATELKNQINDKVVDFRANITQMRKQFEADLAIAAQTVSANLSQFKTEMGQQIISLEKKLIDKMGEGIAKNKDMASSAIDAGKASLQGIISKHKTSLGQVITKNQVNLSITISDTETKLQHAVAAEMDTLTTQTNAELASFGTQTAKIINSTKKTIIDHTSAAVATATANKDALIKAKTNFNEQIAHILSETQDGIKTIYVQLDADLKKPVEDYKESSVREIDAALGDVTQMATEAVDTYTKSAEDLSLKMKESTDTLRAGINKYTNSANQQVSDASSAGVAAIATTSNGVRSNIDLALKDWLAKVQTAATNSVQGIDKAITAGISAADSPRKILADSWTSITETELVEAEKTWALVGEKAIYPHVEVIIRNAKSAITLVVPKFDDLNWDLVKTMRAKGVKFTIACMYETARNPKAPKSMVENGVDLWGYAEKDMIAAVRDQEEILIAPVAPKEDETVAIVSSATPLVKNLGTMILDFYRRTAKKYQIL